MTKIFISYRRKDNPFAARSVYEALRAEFGKDNVFYDVERMRAGKDFREQIDEMLTWCDVMLVVMGDQWLQLDASGRPRLEDPEDSLRIEVSTALDRDIPVIPVLIGDAPSLQSLKPSLPEDVKSLIYRHYIVIKPGEDFKAHIDKLINQISIETTKREENHEAHQPSDNEHSTATDSEEQPKPGIFKYRRFWKFYIGALSLLSVIVIAWYTTANQYCVSNISLDDPFYNGSLVTISGKVTSSFLCPDTKRLEVNWGDNHLLKTSKARLFYNMVSLPATHQYSEPGQYKAFFKAENDFNSSVESVNITITETPSVDPVPSDVNKVIKQLKEFSNFSSNVATTEGAIEILKSLGLQEISWKDGEYATAPIDNQFKVTIWAQSYDKPNVFGVRYGTNEPSWDWEATYFEIVIPHDFVVTNCQPNLTLNQPEIAEMTVTINGVVSPTSGCPEIVRMSWRWGDGSEANSWFPASHQYNESGEYEISVTAYDADKNSTTESARIRIVEPEQVKEAIVETPYKGIKVTSKPPGASIFIDGALVGNTPASLKSLERDQTAIIRLQMEGYEPSEQVVTAPHEGMGEVSFTLQKIIHKYALTINTEPTDAKIRFLSTGQEYQTGVMLIPGRYHIEVSREGFVTQTQWVEIESRNLSLDFVLETEKPEFVDGQTFKDCDVCPEMVVIPAGSFVMGGSGRYEKPQHKVNVARFALGKVEVTFDEYDAFARSTGKNPPEDEGWGRGKRPVINVWWSDAQAYVEWLSKRTGKRYRLPSEAEWEYAARAGTKWAYWWGDDIKKGGKVWANCSECGSKWGARRTHPVETFSVNPFGLYDTSGNVYEWVKDCWHDDYRYAPDDGSAWLKAEDCNRRVIRGGSWANGPAKLRSAFRHGTATDDASGLVGFRLAQDLD